MVAHSITMTPERVVQALDLSRRGFTLSGAAKAMGIPTNTLDRWAKSRKVTFTDGRTTTGRVKSRFSRSEAFVAAARQNAAKATAASAERNRLPLSPEERKAYQRHYAKLLACGIKATRAEVFTAIGRPDLAESIQ